MNFYIDNSDISILEIFNFINANSFENFDEEFLALYSKKIFEYANIITFRDTIDNKIIGFAAYYDNAPEKKYVYITFIGVSKDFRKKGIASGLLRQIELVAKQKGFRGIKLEVRTDNINAKKFYEKRGFVFCDYASTVSEYLIKDL
ncbi:MAG: GNAT family N-acetyltransferase [Eubacterium sp.]|nr:GNAT family N-acetyltransferase [Eubacterium sp.]